MMLDPKHFKLYFLLIAFFQMNILSSQNTEDLVRQIRIYFEQLQTAKSNEPISAIVDYYPIFEPCKFQAFINEEKNKSGALCKEYLVSEKLLILRNIYILSINGETNSLYNLVDCNGKRIHDILRNNCSPNQFGKIDTINQIAINDLENSYKEWYKLVKENGLEKTRKENIDPTSFSKYKWLKEIGYLSGEQTNTEILKKYLEIKKDSSYLNYYIISQGLTRIYKETNCSEIINQVIILTLINNQTSFTTNILKFKLEGKETDINKILEQLELDSSANNLLQLLKEYNVSIVLNI